MATIINKTLQGISWNFRSQLITQVINFIVAFLLMRWLSPDDFGKFAMVFVVFSFLQIFRDVGFTVAIIQKKEVNSSMLSTAFWFHIFLAAIFASVLLFSGKYFNSFYQTKGLEEISFWLSVDFFIGSLGLVPIAFLRKELKFKTLFIAQFLAVIISSIVGITMAIKGMGYLSLIGKMIVFTSIYSLSTLFFVNWKPQFHFSYQGFRELTRLGLPDTGNHVLSYLVRNVDDFFIGRVMGSTALGFYNRAYVIMLLPMVNLTSVLQNVLFSTWSKMQDQVERVSKMYIQVTGIISLITFPLMTLLAVFSEPIISIVFGEKWLPMATTLSILSIVGMFHSVTSMIGIIFIVFDKNRLAFKINLITSLITISLIVWTVYFYKSIEVTALVYGVASILLYIPSYYYASKIMRTNLLKLITPMFSPLVCSVLMGLLGWFLFKYMHFNSLKLKLAISSILTLLLYLLIAKFFIRNSMNDIIRISKYYTSKTK